MYKLIKLGLGNHEPVGDHPGWLIFITFMVASVIYGQLVGLIIGFIFIGIPFLIGAYERGKLIQKWNKNKT